MDIGSHRTLGANAGRARRHNRRLVMGQVRAAGRIGRAEIARASGLSTQAVSNIIADLLDDGMIVERGARAGTRGLPAQQYAIRPDGGFAFGFEVRPNAVLCTVLNLGGQTEFAGQMPLKTPDWVEVTDAATDLQARALAKTGTPRDRILGAGIVMPGPLQPTGIQGSGSDLPAWDGDRPEAWFGAALDLPVFVENDANAAAMAERITGTAQGLDSFAFLYFGAGLGLGLVHRGQLIGGAAGNAGEIGHIPVPSDGQTVPLESAVSRLSVERHLRDAGYRVKTAADLDRLFKAGNPALLAWLDRAREPLAAAVTIIENMFDPETIIAGGAMPEAVLDHLIADIRFCDRSVANRAGRSMPRLIRGSSGRMAATHGAAALVLNQAFTPAIAIAR